MVISTIDTVGGDLPFKLGGNAVIPGFNDLDFDVFVSNLALNLHITKENPYQRQTAEWRKQQIDTAAEAGEQTITDWWVRSQMTFQLGAGINYLDSTSQQNNTNRQRFADSRGIDCWTPGVIKRLPDTALLDGLSGVIRLATASVAGHTYLLFAQGAVLKTRREDDVIATLNTGSVNTIKSLVTDGSNYYVATQDGVFKGAITGGTGALVWNLPTSAVVTLGWVKQRLMAGVDNKVYELAGSGGPTLPAALYSHPNVNWTWSAFADAPASIIAAGSAGLVSALFGFDEDNGTGAPILQPGAQLAELPTGEVVTSLYLYVGSILCIGTSRGLRTGTFNQLYGTFTYGPLTFQTGGAVTALTGRGSFVYCGTTVGGESMLVRVDLGSQTADGGVYAWAPDLRCPTPGVTGRINSIVVTAEGLLAIAPQDYGVVREALTYDSPRPAYLRTARVRMSTVEPKQFKYGRIRTEGEGTVAVVADTETTNRSVFSTASQVASARFSLISGPCEWIQLTFTLTGQAQLTSYQVLALPAQPRSRLFALPVSLFDTEINRNGKTIGYPGRAKQYLDAIEAIESSGDEVVIQSPVLGIDAVRCVVERIEFTQTVNPTGGKSYGLGGYANLIFRTTT